MRIFGLFFWSTIGMLNAIDGKWHNAIPCMFAAFIWIILVKAMDSKP